jgi:hypothetical protein
MAPRWPRGLCPAWLALVGWTAHTPADHGPTHSTGRPLAPATGIRGTSTAAGPGSGTACDRASVAPPPPILPPVTLAAAAPTDSREPSQRRVEARHCARLPALIATLPSPDREIVLLRIVAGVSIPNIAAALGVTPAAIHRTQRHALSALQPTAPGPHGPPATRGRVVLLPHAHARPEATVTSLTTRRTARGAGMNHNGSSQHRLAPSHNTTGVIAADVAWHDVELALTVARHSYDRWLTAVQDTPSLATMHAYHTHEALHEAAHARTTLIDTFRAEAAALITTPVPDTRPIGVTQAPEEFRCPTG